MRCRWLEFGALPRWRFDARAHLLEVDLQLDAGSHLLTVRGG